LSGSAAPQAEPQAEGAGSAAPQAEGAGSAAPQAEGAGSAAPHAEAGASFGSAVPQALFSVLYAATLFSISLMACTSFLESGFPVVFSIAEKSESHKYALFCASVTKK